MSEKKIKKYTGIAKKLKIVGIILVVLGTYVIAGDIYKAINSKFNKGQLIVGIIMIMSGVISLVIFNKYKQKISEKTIWELISLKLTSNLMKTLALISYVVFFVGVFILGYLGLVGDNFPLWGYFFEIITISSGLFFRVGSSKVAEIENSRRKLNLGTFSFTDEDRKRIKFISLQYFPKDLTTPKAQLELLNSLSCVMGISDYRRRQFEYLLEEMDAERFKKVVAETIIFVDNELSRQNTVFLTQMVEDATTVKLITSWGVLDYYAYLLKPEYTQNIQHYRDYIHNILLERNQTDNDTQIIKCAGTSIYFNSKAFFEWKKQPVSELQYEFRDAISLTEKEPVISFYEDGVKTVEYCLQTKNEENFTGKYFLISVRVGLTGNPAVPTMQMDGFISDTPEERALTLNDVGYRMEGHYLSCGNELSNHRSTAKRGRDLIEKGLRYAGYTTPGNVRMVGICQNCKKSITFKAYNIYFNSDEPVYSDDGLNVCYISEYEMDAKKFDKENWAYEKNGKTYRYYNSFCCPHCGEPYIDYKKYKEMKISGICACVFLDDSTERIELQSN